MFLGVSSIRQQALRKTVEKIPSKHLSLMFFFKNSAVHIESWCVVVDKVWDKNLGKPRFLSSIMVEAC